MKPVETIRKGRAVAKLYVDENPPDPREEFDHPGATMLCFHSRYTLGDPTPLLEERGHRLDPGDFSGWGEMEDHIRTELGAVVLLPLFLYDHSGLRMKVGSFRGLLPQGHAEFDSGQVGFIFSTQADVDEQWEGDPEKAEECLRAEVKEYDQYLSGAVYGYEVSVAGEVVDSCWGLYGWEYAVEEAKHAMDSPELYK